MRPADVPATIEAFAEPLPREFYERPADEVAPALLGQYLVVTREGRRRAGRIVETEAYLGEADLACHAARGRTRRTATLYGSPGTAYVYLIYGVHELFNAVCQPVGEPHAVLVRAVELIGAPPDVSGAGPGRLTRALGITRADNGTSLTEPPVTIHPGEPVDDVAVSPRVGVAYAEEWAAAPLRFYDAASGAVSKPPRSAIVWGSRAAEGR